MYKYIYEGGDRTISRITCKKGENKMELYL